MVRKVTVVVSGVRRAAAIVETSAIDLTSNSDGHLEGSKSIDVSDPVSVALTLTDQPGATFECSITLRQMGTATRKGKLTDDFAFRFYDIPFSDFQ